jgi:hypothetical protein
VGEEKELLGEALLMGMGGLEAEEEFYAGAGAVTEMEMAVGEESGSESGSDIDLHTPLP